MRKINAIIKDYNILPLVIVLLLTGCSLFAWVYTTDPEFKKGALIKESSFEKIGTFSTYKLDKLTLANNGILNLKISEIKVNRLTRTLQYEKIKEWSTYEKDYRDCLTCPKHNLKIFREIVTPPYLEKELKEETLSFDGSPNGIAKVKASGKTYSVNIENGLGAVNINESVMRAARGGVTQISIAVTFNNMKETKVLNIKENAKDFKVKENAATLAKQNNPENVLHDICNYQIQIDIMKNQLNIEKRSSQVGGVVNTERIYTYSKSIVVFEEMQKPQIKKWESLTNNKWEEHLCKK